MTTRRRWHLSALAIAALVAAGCGGGNSTDAPIATRVVAFGDSLTDIGTYTGATSLTATPGAAPYFGGKFTTNTFTEYTLPAAGTARAANTSTANIWVEWVAARLGVPITPAEAGFATTRVPCPAQASGLPNSCTGYAQGGSRVTDPNGIGKSGGALTVPLVAQVASHNTRSVTGFQTGFNSGDIVFVYGGNNDVFIQFGAVGQGLPAATAIANVQTAANELVALVKNEILAKGAERVAVMTLPDSSVTPGFTGLPAPNRALLSQLSAEFNTVLTTGLADTSARIIDARALLTTALASAASLGITNTTTAACSPAKLAAITGNRVTDGSSLFCNATPGVPFNGITTGVNASTYAFADGVHPTSASHKIFADQVIAAIKNFGWIPDNL
jgi:outer membrane lipase/esterase